MDTWTLVLLSASASLAVGVVAAGRRRPGAAWWRSTTAWRALGPVAMLGGTAAMVASPSLPVLSLLGVAFIGVAAVEVARAVVGHRYGSGAAEPLIGLGCAVAMVVMAMTMTPMPSGMAMTHALDPVPRALVALLVVAASVAALGRLVGSLVGSMSGRRAACAASHCLMCAGMGLPLLFVA